MKKFKTANKAKRHLIQHLVNSFGERQHKVAYRSIVANITGLTRKVQSLHHLLKNQANYIDKIEAENVLLKRDLLLGDKVNSACSMGVGDGTGNLVVYGDYESIKAAQAFVFRAEDATKQSDYWKEAATKAHEEAEESLTLAKHWRRVAEDAQAELEKQEPVDFRWRWASDDNSVWTYCHMDKFKDAIAAFGDNVIIELIYSRPAPAAILRNIEEAK